MLEAQQHTFFSLVFETSLFVDNSWLWLMLDHGAAHLCSRSFLQRDANKTEKVLFIMFFAFVLNGHKAEECNPCPRGQEFWTSCTGVPWKCPFLSIMRNFGYSRLMKMQILVGRVLHTGTEITMEMWYLGCFGFSFCQRYMVNKKRHYSAGGTTLHMFHIHYSRRDWVVHILYNSNFVSGKSFLCIMHEFWHSSNT